MTSEAIAANFDGQQLFAIVETKIEKYPYAEENDEYMPDFLRVYSESTEMDYDPHEDMTFDSWEGLVRKVYEGRKEQPPVPVRSFDELLGQEMDGQEGEKVLIDGVESYLYCYGLESANLYWVREVPVYAAFCATRQEAEKLLETNRSQLRTPKVQPVPLGKLLER